MVLKGKNTQTYHMVELHILYYEQAVRDTKWKKGLLDKSV